jgi:hypothetical protein
MTDDAGQVYGLSGAPKPKWQIAALILAALLLPLLVFHYGFAPYRCVYDVCTMDRALWGRHTVIYEKPVALRNLHTGKLALENGKPIMVTPMREGMTGIVIRDGIPAIVGRLGGLLAPIILLTVAGVISLRATRN